MAFAVIHWGKPRKPRPTYASVCLLLNGGCYRNVGRFMLKWCPGCRRLSMDRANAKRRARES